MRVISQNGKFDFPYEKCCIWIDENSKYVRLSPIGEPDSNYVFALYSTEEKAEKAMEMLREEYRFEKLFETLCSGMGDYPNKPFYYFQFPKDEDVEV